MNRPEGYTARLSSLSHRYGRINALQGVDLALPAGCMAALIGPDGVGKSTLLGIVAGAVAIQSGEVSVLDGDMRSAAYRRRVASSAKDRKSVV